jgi:hypothetical protein
MFKFQELVTFHICNVKYQAILEKCDRGAWKATWINPIFHVSEGYGRTKREAVKDLIFHFVMSSTSLPSANYVMP